MTRVTGRASAVVAAVVCAWLGATASVRAEVRVHVDCHLESGPVECRALESAFFESMGSSVGRSPRGAEVALRVRAIGLATSTRYEISSSAGAERLSLSESVPDAVDRDATLLRVASLLERGTLPFLPVSGASVGEDGELRLRTHGGARAGASEDGDDEDDPFYLRPSLSGELVQQGVSIVSLTASVEASYSSEKWRLLTSARSAYRHLRIDIPGAQRLEGSVWSGSGSAVLARTIDGGLSVAALGDGGRATQNNLDAWATGGVGVEWIRVPIRRDEESNFGARYRILAVSHDYVSPNVYGEDRRIFARHALSAFVSWHTDALDLKLDTSGTMVLDRPEAWDVSGEVECTWRVTEAFEITLSSWLTYRGQAVNQPRDPNGLDPIAVVVNGSDFGSTSYGGELGFSYTFGNGLMHARDQRWK